MEEHLTKHHEENISAKRQEMNSHIIGECIIIKS